MESLMTKQEYADFWRVSPGTVDKWVAEGKVEPVYTPGGTPRFRHPSVQRATAVSGYAEGSLL